MVHNDHLQQPIIERRRGMAKGIYYTGMALISADFILIAPNIETLRERWAIFTDMPVNEEKCIEVGLFATRDIQDLPMEPPQ